MREKIADKMIAVLGKGRAIQISRNRAKKNVDPQFILSADNFMGLARLVPFNKTKFSISDDPSCGRLGIIRLERNEHVYCNIEDFSDTQLQETDYIKYQYTGREF